MIGKTFSLLDTETFMGMETSLWLGQEEEEEIIQSSIYHKNYLITKRNKWTQIPISLHSRYVSLFYWYSRNNEQNYVIFVAI